jgi:hypothetical protein
MTEKDKPGMTFYLYLVAQTVAQIHLKLDAVRVRPRVSADQFF